MSCAKPWYDKSNEDAKPGVEAETLKVRQAKAEAIKAVERQQAAERKSKFAFKKPSSTGFAEKHAAWRAGFDQHRQQQKTFTQWAAKSRFPVKYFGGRRDCKATATFDLARYRPLDVDCESENFKLFDRCWNEYDDEGFGKLSYKKFEALLKDIGYEFARPSWKQVDPQRSQEVSFASALEWWSRSLDKADIVQRASPKKAKAAKKVKEGKFIIDTKNEVQLFSNPQVRRARNNARTKLSAASKKFRQFRQDKRSANSETKAFDNEKTVATYYLKGAKAIKFDLTDYKPVAIQISKQQQSAVDTVWKQYDAKGIGSMSYETFQKMMQDPKMFQKADCSFAKEGSDIKYEDFLQWWFVEDKAEEKEQEPSKREMDRVNQMLENKGKVAAIKKELRNKYSGAREKFRKFRKTPRKEKQAPWKVEISTQKDGNTKKYEYDISNYAPAYIPKGKEQELQQLDLIWMKFDKEGSGQLDATKLQKVLGKVGLELTDDRTAKQLQNDAGHVTFEKFSTWWFSTATKDTAPKAPPAPQEKQQMVSAIRAAEKNVAKKSKEKYQLAEDGEWAKMRFTAQQEARKRSEAFKKFRVENSPSPRKQRPGAACVGKVTPVKDRSAFDVEVRCNHPSLQVKGVALTY